VACRYLNFASNAGIVVTTGYRNDQIGHGETLPNGAGRFLAVVLQPKISVHEGADLEFAAELHHKVREFCPIARAVNFPVSCESTFNVVAQYSLHEKRLSKSDVGRIHLSEVGCSVHSTRSPIDARLRCRLYAQDLTSGLMPSVLRERLLTCPQN
jgi:hypothetical protein